MNLNIPITQTITLPDSWQACKTPQELSYWIIAKFDNFTTQFTEINNAMSALQSMIETNTANIATNDAEIAEIKNTLTSINSDIATLQTDYNTLNTDLTTLHGLHQQLSNKVASMEDAVLDLPGIKQDITALQTSVSTLQTNVSKNTADIDGLQTSINSNASAIQVNGDKIFAITKTYYYRNRTDKLFYWNFVNNSSTTMLITSVDYRTFIDVSSESDLGHSFTIYYNSTNNIPFGTYDSSISGTDIIVAMEEASIDGGAFKTEILARTKVAIRFFYIGMINDAKTYSWAVL